PLIKRLDHRPDRSDGMRPACYAKTPDQNRIGSLEKPQRHVERRILFQLAIYPRKFAECFSLTNVDDHGRFRAFFLRFNYEFVKFTEETDREIIDAEKSTVFEGSQEGSLPGAAQARDDHERGWLHG